MAEPIRNIIGEFSNPYQQTYPDTCAIKSQQLILNDFGVPITEDQCIEYSIEQGWYHNDGSGTQGGDVGKLLCDAGIPCTQTDGANVYDIVNQLSQGHKVIVGVDSGELWDGNLIDWLKDFFLGDTPDHALIVAGIDISDPANPMVSLTDPGTGQPAAVYPLDQFMDAWSDSNCFMVSTDVATPEATQSFAENGLTDGHLNEISEVDYSTFVQFQNYSHQIDYATQSTQLYDLFQNYPDMGPDATFADALIQYDMPAYDPTLASLPTNYIDSFMFDYNNLYDTSWINTSPMFNIESADYGINDAQQHSLEVLQRSLDSAQQHADSCLDDGMYL